MKLDPADIRARNFIKQTQMPFHTLTDRDYDVGDFEGAMRACLKKADREGFDARAAAAKRAGQGARLRLRQLHRMHRLGRGRGGLGHAERGRHADRRHRHAIDRAGPRDRLCAGRLRAVRPAAGAHPRHPGRHRAHPHRQRHRRLALDPDRRGDGRPRLDQARRLPEGARRRQAGGGGRRPRNRRRQVPHRRHRPRHRSRRTRGAAAGDGAKN